MGADIGEFHFTIEDVTGNFSDAVSLCKTSNNPELAVVNDSYAQAALAQFLNGLRLTSTLYINIRLYQAQDNSWFLVDGSKYIGEFALLSFITIHPDNQKIGLTI